MEQQSLTTSINVIRECGTQVRESHLEPHRQKFNIVSKRETTISRERCLFDNRVARTMDLRKKNKSTQTGRFGPVGKRGKLKFLSIKRPSEKCLEEIYKDPKRPRTEERDSPKIFEVEILNSTHGVLQSVTPEN